MSESEPTEENSQPSRPRADYMMGSSDSETRRLIRQSGFYGHITWRLLREAGLQPGLSVLDVGTGAGDVALLAAELVGSTGKVVGIDQDPEVLSTARARAEEAGYTNTEFLQGGIDLADTDEPWDAVVGRFVLMYQPDPSQALSSLVRTVRSGGIVAFQEMNPLSARQVSDRSTPLWDQASDWLHTTIERAGIETEMGYKIHGAYLEAGLPAPEMELFAPLSGSSNWRGQEYFTETLRSLLPLAEKFGVATKEEVQIDSLAERLIEETLSRGGVLKTPDVVNAWAVKA